MKPTALLPSVLLLGTQITGGLAYGSASSNALDHALHRRTTHHSSSGSSGSSGSSHVSTAQHQSTGSLPSTGSSSGGSSSGGLFSSRGSKLDFAGNVIGAAGNVIPAFIPPPQPEQPQMPQMAPPQKRDLDGFALEPREKKYTESQVMAMAAMLQKSGGMPGGADAGAAMGAGAGAAPKAKRNLMAREARGGGGGMHMPSFSSRGSKLDFAGNVIGAAGNVAGALIPPQQPAMPQQAPPQMRKRSLEDFVLEAREARGGGMHMPSFSSRGSKLDFAGNVVGAAGDVAGALISPPQPQVMAPPQQ